MSMGGSGKLGWMLWKVLNAFMWENRAANGQKIPFDIFKDKFMGARGPTRFKK